MLRKSVINLLRFKTSTLLNVIGLTIAFASFIIIMIQVNHDLNFDKHYPGSERIFELEVSDFPGRNFDPFVTRLFADHSIEISPEIEKGGYILYAGEIPFFVTEKGQQEQLLEVGLITSPEIYDVFGFKCLAGNFADYGAAPDRIIISRDVAHRFFGNDDPIGKKMKVNRTNEFVPNEMEIVAVFENLPKNSSIPNGIFMNIGDSFKGDKTSGNFRTFLKTSSVNVKELENLLESEAPDLLFYQIEDPGHKFVRLTNLHESYFNTAESRLPKGNKTTVYSLLAVGILIILIAMVNFVNLSMSLIPRRMRSINTRKVLGGRNYYIWLEQLVDATILAIFSLLLAIALVNILSNSSFQSLLSADMNLLNNLPLILLTFFIAVFIGIAAALYPALYSTSFSPALVLKGSFGLSPKGRKLRTSLIGLQYLISITLIIVAIFIQVQYEWMRHYDIGINKENVVKIRLSESLMNKRSVLTNEIKNIPDVKDIAFTWSDLFSNTMNWNRIIHGETAAFSAQVVTPNLLSMLNVEITEGRDFLESDGVNNGALIFNETGRREFDLSIGDKIWGLEEECPIVGFCNDFNFLPLIYPVTPLALYVCEEKEMIGPLSMVYVKVNSTNISSTISDIRNMLLNLDPTFSKLLDIEFLDESIGNLYHKEKTLASLVTLFSLLAIMISTIGVLGLIMFESQYRRKEIGLRKVFGATISEILGMFNKLYVRIVIASFIFATPLAYYIIKNWQSNFAYQAPVAIWIFGAALLVTLLITIMAVSIQSYHAAIENPVESIKTD